MTGRGQGPVRVRMPYVERLFQTLSVRDWAVIDSLARVHVASSFQLERLHFSDLAGRSRTVKRGQVLKRLVNARVLNTLDRPIGSVGGGSASLCYVLDSAGQRLVRLRAAAELSPARLRRPRPPGERFVAHGLAVTELYVGLVEGSRRNGFMLDTFQAEADAYWPNGLGGWVKPDAFIRLHQNEVADYWWYEADLATESLPTIRGKLLAYLDFVHRGQLGPDNIVPRVVFAVPTSKRQAAVQSVVTRLPDPAGALFLVLPMARAAGIIAEELTKQ